MTHAQKGTADGRCVLDCGVDRTSTTGHYECCRDYKQRGQSQQQTGEPDWELGYQRTTRSSCEHIQAIEGE